MKSVNELIVSAEETGRHAAEMAAQDLRGGTVVVAGTSIHNPGEDTGRLVLDAYRSHGTEAVNSAVRAYRDGYNARARQLGADTVDWEQIRNGIGWALDGATDDERAAIPAAL
ncbi:hypothetical protein LVY72_13905 [Arthrobacter sp. I2-34]|uniref:Uncharacterized protein n=1 Tax=Arthrobacter hankyongi TaxID=2904801 RepID=A0ABS9L8K3_9MICC|nr:hypothetical protein [Arthrobacter hankyongi]MCG2622992.1 hypothetical protein [Arthrobacter hankyongi]